MKALAFFFRAAVGDHKRKIIGEHKGNAFTTDFPFLFEIAENMAEVCSGSEREPMNKIRRVFPFDF